MSILLGIDSCPGGWIALSLDTENQNLELIQRAHWNHLPRHRCTLAAVDMPVGLTDTALPRKAAARNDVIDAGLGFAAVTDCYHSSMMDSCF